MDEEGEIYEGPAASEVCCHLTGAERITSTISHHLKELEGAGIVRIERRGKRMVCTLRGEALETFTDALRLLTKGETTHECGQDASVPE